MCMTWSIISQFHPSWFDSTYVEALLKATLLKMPGQVVAYNYFSYNLFTYTGIAYNVDIYNLFSYNRDIHTVLV